MAIAKKKSPKKAVRKPLSKAAIKKKVIKDVLYIIDDELSWETDVAHIARMIRRIKALA